MMIIIVIVFMIIFALKKKRTPTLKEKKHIYFKAINKGDKVKAFRAGRKYYEALYERELNYYDDEVILNELYDQQYTISHPITKLVTNLN